MMNGHVSKRSWNKMQTGLLEARSFIAIKLDAHAEFAIERIGGFQANHLTGAAPLRRGLAGDFLGHLQKDFHDFAFGNTRACREEDAASGKIHRFGPLFGKAGLPNADSKSDSDVVTLRETTIARENLEQVIHVNLRSPRRELARDNLGKGFELCEETHRLAQAQFSAAPRTISGDSNVEQFLEWSYCGNLVRNRDCDSVESKPRIYAGSENRTLALLELEHTRGSDSLLEMPRATRQLRRIPHVSHSRLPYQYPEEACRDSKDSHNSFRSGVARSD